MENAGNAEAGHAGVLSPDGRWLWDGAQWVSTLSPDGKYVWTAAGWRPIRTPFWTPGKIIGFLVIAAIVIGLAILFIAAHQEQARSEREVHQYFCRYDDSGKLLPPEERDCP